MFSKHHKSMILENEELYSLFISFYSCVCVSFREHYWGKVFLKKKRKSSLSCLSRIFIILHDRASWREPTGECRSAHKQESISILDAQVHLDLCWS